MRRKNWRNEPALRIDNNGERFAAGGRRWVLENCRQRARINPRDFVAHGRRGPTSLVPGRGAEARAGFDRPPGLNPA